MNATTFKGANAEVKAPEDLTETQCLTISAYVGKVEGGSCDGARQVIVAWQPTSAELEALNAGAPVFLAVLGGLPPHTITTSFEEARRCA